MKKKILALAFVALMTLGFAKTAKSETPPREECMTVSVRCGDRGFTGIICGMGATEEQIENEQMEQLDFLFRHFCL